MRATSILNDFSQSYGKFKNLSGGSLAVCEDSQEQAQRCETTSETVSRPRRVQGSTPWLGAR